MTQNQTELGSVYLRRLQGWRALAEELRDLCYQQDRDQSTKYLLMLSTQNGMISQPLELDELDDLFEFISARIGMLEDMIERL